MAENFYDQYRKANQYAMLGNIGRGLLGAYASGMPTGQGLAYGLSQGQSQMDPLQMLRLREELAEKEAERGRERSYQEMIGGRDPESGIDWKPHPKMRALLGRAPEGMSTLLGNMPREEGMPVLADYLMREPEAPKTREIKRDNEVVTQEFGPEGWQDVSTAPRWSPEKTDTSDIREYQHARRQGYEGSFMDYQKDLRKAGATTVNVGPTGIDYGDPPKDFAWARNPDGTVALEEDKRTGFARPVAVPIARGPVEIEQEEAKRAQEAQHAQRTKYADVVVQDIDRALDIVESSQIPVTGYGSYLQAIPGTPARDVAALVDTVRANVGFDRLQEMRDSSPTGGALGQVSELENRLMQATLGNLEMSQSEDQFKKNLNRVRETYLDIIHGPGNRPTAPEPTETPQQPASPESSPETDYTAMTVEQLVEIDPSTLSGPALDAYIQALEALTASPQQ